jgi:hypothetical protein
MVLLLAGFVLGCDSGPNQPAEITSASVNLATRKLIHDRTWSAGTARDLFRIPENRFEHFGGQLAGGRVLV